MYQITVLATGNYTISRSPNLNLENTPSHFDFFQSYIRYFFYSPILFTKSDQITKRRNVFYSFLGQDENFLILLRSSKVIQKSADIDKDVKFTFIKLFLFIIDFLVAHLLRLTVPFCIRLDLSWLNEKSKVLLCVQQHLLWTSTFDYLFVHDTTRNGLIGYK